VIVRLCPDLARYGVDCDALQERLRQSHPGLDVQIARGPCEAAEGWVGPHAGRSGPFVLAVCRRTGRGELTLNLRWAWHHGTDELWAELDPELWALTHNPWVVLQTVSRSKLRQLLARPEYRTRVTSLLEQRRDSLVSPAWFQQSHPQSPLTHVAYFSMEFALSEALPIYSGGLGNVAGDQLKAASDLGVPVVGVGLLYQQGYFRQAIAADGSQEELYPYNDPAQLPISPVRDDGGEWIRIPIELPGAKIWLRAWRVQVGRLALYLLDLAGHHGHHRAGRGQRLRRRAVDHAHRRPEEPRPLCPRARGPAGRLHGVTRWNGPGSSTNPIRSRVNR
jgi:hypothetical protein